MTSKNRFPVEVMERMELSFSHHYVCGMRVEVSPEHMSEPVVWLVVFV